jgi:hypothetical protein
MTKILLEEKDFEMLLSKAPDYDMRQDDLRRNLNPSIGRWPYQNYVQWQRQKINYTVVVDEVKVYFNIIKSINNEVGDLVISKSINEVLEDK